MHRYKVFSGIDLSSTAGTEIIWRGGIDMNIAFEVDAALAAKDSALRNCMLLAMRRLHKGSTEIADWEHVIRFCKEAGVEPSPMREAIEADQERSNG